MKKFNDFLCKNVITIWIIFNKNKNKKLKYNSTKGVFNNMRVYEQGYCFKLEMTSMAGMKNDLNFCAFFTFFGSFPILLHLSDVSAKSPHNRFRLFPATESTNLSITSRSDSEHRLFFLIPSELQALLSWYSLKKIQWPSWINYHRNVSW